MRASKEFRDLEKRQQFLSWHRLLQFLCTWNIARKNHLQEESQAQLRRVKRECMSILISQNKYRKNPRLFWLKPNKILELIATTFRSWQQGDNRNWALAQSCILSCTHIHLG